MKKNVSIALMLVVILGMLVGCGEKSTSDAEKGNKSGKAPVEIKIATVGNEEHQSTIMAKLFEEELEKVYDGDVKVSIYSNGSLGGEREAAEGVKLGTIQMTVVTSDGALPAWVPDIQVLSIPYLFENKEQAFKILDGVMSEQLNPKFEKQGFKHLGFGELGFRHFTNNKKEIRSVKDMEGLSIRVQEAPIWFALMKSLKASAVPVSFNELYTALQQGMVDGQENPIASIATSKFNEVQKYLTLDGHTYAAVSMVMNKSFYDGLSEELKSAIDQAAKNSIPRQRKAIDDKEQAYLKQLEDSGMVITDPDKKSFVEATKDLYTKEEVKKLVDPNLVELVMQNK